MNPDVVNVAAALEDAKKHSPEARGLSPMARAIVGSQILKIAYEVRDQIAAGKSILNLTVGDFSPKEFPVPRVLSEGIKTAVDKGLTNYPPSNGLVECREAIRAMYKARLGLDYPLESFIVASGARPMIAGTYMALVGPNDPVVYGVPSWNNHYYCTIVGASRVQLTGTAATNFFATVDQIAPYVDSARMICLNTPQNPTGTVMPREDLEAICTMIVDENRRRQSAGRPALYLLFDQVYWMLTFGGARHHTPVELNPDMAPYTILVDGISKSFAATGLRVGWAVGPTDVMGKVNALLTHIGAWAPKPEQMATANLLADTKAVDAYLAEMTSGVLARLEALSEGVKRLKSLGHDVDAIAPQGAIYLSMRFNLAGKKTPQGQVLETDEDIRKFLLAEADIALIPFQCFGVEEDTRWFRASVGTVSVAECKSIGERLERALSKLS